jgi:uncharacterized protein
LACDHCYVYEHSDQTWRGRPLALSEVAAATAVQRIAEHAKAHALPQVTIVLHGGEPLLYGVERTRALLTLLHESVGAPTELDLRIHTNGVRLDRAFLELFLEFGVKVGVSLDGDRPANDLHRLYANGKTSHPAVLRALQLLREPRYRSLYAGILCTIDLRNDPIAVYEALAAEQPPRADLLLPHATWDHPPLRSTDEAAAERGYAQWLEAVYDRWQDQGRPFSLRTFDSITALLQGSPSGTEALGLAPRDLIVLETDGTYEQADSLKTAYDGAAATGLNVFEHSLDEAAAHPGLVARQGGIDALCATCRACPVVEVCGGGLYAHRYRTGAGFDNPSVFCADLKALIEYIEPRTARTPRTESERIAVRHVLPPEDFDAFASGYGDADAVRRLGEPQKSIRRALIAEVARRSAADSPFAEAMAEIVRLDTAGPDALEAVLAHPYTRVWAIQLLEATGGERGQGGGGDQGGEGGAGSAALGHRDFARLAEIAAAAALIAGESVRLPLYPVDGIVQLPTLGALVLGGSPDGFASIEIWEGGDAIVEADGSKYELHLGAAELGSTPRWLPQRRLEFGPLSVAIEDTDPYRRLKEWRAADRLSDGDLDAWRERFAAAVTYLEGALPAYLPGLGSGLKAITPLMRTSSSSNTSGTPRQAYGLIGAALPADGPTLALLMAHEFQHVKLGALLDVYDFFDEDPRPLEGLFQGTYAHLAVTEYWRVRRFEPAGTAADTAAAEAEFTRWRTHTAEAVETLLGSGSLTALGEHFARAMGETLAPWLEEPVGAGAARVAGRRAAAHRVAWEARRKE